MKTPTTIDAGTSRTRTAPEPMYPGLASTNPRTLAQAVQAAVEEIPGESLRRFAPNEPAPFVQSRALVALLADCYARHIYSSTDVVCRAVSDPDLLWPWWVELPDGRGLRHFRVQNREAVHYCLVAALRFLVEEKILAGGLTKVDSPQIAEEARRRIIMAAFADSTELDGEASR